MNAFRLAASRVAPRALNRVVMNSAHKTTSLMPQLSLGQNALRTLATTVTTTTTPAKSPDLHELGSVDHGYEDDRVDKIAEPDRRAFTYLMLSTVRFAYASAARLLVVRLVAVLSASADVLALAFAEFEVDKMEKGETILVNWRGKPIYILRRTEKQMSIDNGVPMAHLRDPANEAERTENPEFSVVIGICPHLGCVPVPNAGEYDGWLCPCHGSHYDTLGRIRKGPAPLNLDVPPYKFVDEKTILMG